MPSLKLIYDLVFLFFSTIITIYLIIFMKHHSIDTGKYDSQVRSKRLKGN